MVVEWVELHFLFFVRNLRLVEDSMDTEQGEVDEEPVYMVNGRSEVGGMHSV
jgi:hypothetical protein